MNIRNFPGIIILISLMYITGNAQNEKSFTQTFSILFIGPQENSESPHEYPAPAAFHLLSTNSENFSFKQNSSASESVERPNQGRDGLFKVHRVIGYSVAGFSLAAATAGSMLLADYSEDKNPSDALKNTHRALGLITAPLAVANAWLGYRNFNRLTGEKQGMKKRTWHKWIATTAALGYIATGILGVMSTLEFSDAEKTSQVEIINYHRGAAVGSSLLSITAVVVISL